MTQNSGSRDCRDWHWFEVRGEVAEEWGLVGQAHAGDVFAILPDFQNYFDYVVNVALRVDAARDR
jgi:hypothetical protein